MSGEGKDGLPSQFGRYALVDKLATGGMAEVFKAKILSTHGFEKLLVIKRILPNLAADKTFVSMFIDEAKLTAQLIHPKIVQVIDFGDVNGQYFIALEFIDGFDALALLRAAAGKQIKLPVPICVFITMEILDALDYAHNAKDIEGKPMQLVHRDISPSNVFLARRGDVKLGDFGIAHAQERESKTQAGTLKGKYGYMSPEQVVGAKLDARSDVFAVGIVLAEMLMGRRLFNAPNDLDVLLMVRDGRLDRLDKYGKDVPPALDQIVRKSLAKRLADRYQSAAEFRDALSDLLFNFGFRVGPADLGRMSLDYFDQSAEATARLREEVRKWDIVAAGAGARTPITGNALPAQQTPAAASAKIPAARPVREDPVDVVIDEDLLGGGAAGRPANARPAAAPAPALEPQYASAPNYPPAPAQGYEQAPAPNYPQAPAPNYPPAQAPNYPPARTPTYPPAPNYAPQGQPYPQAPAYAPAPNYPPQGQPYPQAPAYAPTPNYAPAQPQQPYPSAQPYPPSAYPQQMPAPEPVPTPASQPPSDPYLMAALDNLLSSKSAAVVDLDQYSFQPGATMPPQARPQAPPHAQPGPVGQFVPAVISHKPASEGDLTTLTPMRIFAELALAKETGLLRFEFPPHAKEVYLVRGAPESVNSNLGNERFGEYLVARGIISPAQLQATLAHLPRFQGKVGEALVSLGIMKTLDVFRLLSQQVRERVMEIFGWQQGHFSYYQSVRNPQEAFPLGLDTFEILGAGVLTLPYEYLDRRFMPHLDHRPSVVPQARINPDAFRLGPTPRELLSMLDGRLTLRNWIGTFTTQEELLTFLRTLYLLAEAGLVTLV